MSKILIENLVKYLGRASQDLDACDLRMYEILCFWTDQIFQYKLAKPKFSSKEVEKITFSLAQILKIETFDGLKNKTISTIELDDMFFKLCSSFDVSDNDAAQHIPVSAQIKDYDNKLNTKGLYYTNIYTYLSPQVKTLQNLKGYLDNTIEGWFKKYIVELCGHEIIVQPPKLSLDVDRCKINFKGLEQPSLIIPKEQLGAYFKLLAKLIIKLSRLKKTQFLLIDEHALISLCHCFLAYLPVINQNQMEDIELIELKEALSYLTELHKKETPLKDILRQSLCNLLFTFGALRIWQTIHETNKPIDRVMVFGYQDILDQEIFDTIELMYKKHAKENIIVSTTEQDIIKANNRNLKAGHQGLTLQTIGHGIPLNETIIYANLGLYRGEAKDTARQLADLINQCLTIDHVKMSCCFSSMVAANADLSKLFEKKPKELPGLRTLTMVTDEDLKPNQPFLMNTAMVHCWNKVKKDGRAFSLTGSPGLIEPELELGHMVWKPYHENIKRIDDQIKEIRVTTSTGPKAKKILN